VLHGRARHEREDSVTLSILQDRLSHLNRCKALEPTPELKSGAEKLVHIGLGSKMRLKGTYEPLATGAGGHGTHMASVTRDWPIFQHLLPEIAFAGHSNSGKSTLVNALIGVSPRLGPANVSDRAGWTDAISFYQVRPFHCTQGALSEHASAYSSGSGPLLSRLSISPATAMPSPAKRRSTCGRA
jgi:hypothetical protein